MSQLYWIINDIFEKTASNVEQVSVDSTIAPGVEVAANVAKGAMKMDTFLDIVENIRPTTTEVNSNKAQPRNYHFEDEDLENIPVSKNEYNHLRDEGR